MHYINDGFAERLKMLRQNRGYTQEQVAEALSIHRTTYTYYEMGRTNPPRDVLHRLVKLFDVSYDELLSGEKTVRVRVAENGGEADKIYNLRKEELDMLTVIRSMSADERKGIETSVARFKGQHGRPSVLRQEADDETK